MPVREIVWPHGTHGLLIDWPHGTHGLLIENAHRLISQEPASASDNLRLLRSTEALHANFYQAFLNKDSVEGGVEDAKRLIKVLEALNAYT